MIVLNMDEYNIHKKTILKDLHKSIFVYPTDTIYGIGCNAQDEKMVSRIRSLKQTTHPFSIIVPDKEWITKNCHVSQEAEEWIRKLPGPYTLILKLKNPKAIAKNVYNNDDSTIGVRMPNHWFSSVASQLKIPIVTTSANVSGEEFMTDIDDLNISIRNNVDYVFYEGNKNGKPSTIVDLSGTGISLKRRDDIKTGTLFPLKHIELKQ